MAELDRSLNTVIGKKITDITINNRGMVTFHICKNMKVTVPYTPIYDEDGNFYLLENVKFKPQEK
jgi:hypothetical protein